MKLMKNIKREYENYRKKVEKVFNEFCDTAMKKFGIERPEIIDIRISYPEFPAIVEYKMSGGCAETEVYEYRNDRINMKVLNIPMNTVSKGVCMRCVAHCVNGEWVVRWGNDYD